MTTDVSVELVSFNLCPFVQRSVITLEEKGVPYRTTSIDLANKPEWFLAISPTGKVPVLRVGEIVLFESAIINEYLDETVPGKRLHPEDPLTRAHHRGWIELASTLFGDLYRLQIAEDEAAARDAAHKAVEKLVKVQGQLQGPYFSGADFALVDGSFAPGLLRLQWCDELAPELNLFDSVPRVREWTSALLERPSVQRSIFAGMQQTFVAWLERRRAWLATKSP